MKKKAIILLLLLCAVVLSGCGCEHDWAEADCVTAKTCTLCNETEGEALGHTWKEATCAVPKTCQTCNATDGETLPHKEGDWQIVSTDIKTLEQTQEKRCKDCGHQLEEKSTVLEKLHSNKKFVLTCDELQRRMQYLLEEELNSGWVKTTEFSRDGGYACGFSSYNSYGSNYDITMIFSTGSSVIPFNAGERECPGAIVLETIPGELGALSMLALPSTLDPSLDDEGSLKVWEKALANPNNTCDYNGIRYMVFRLNDCLYLMAQFP